jgi:hypothetical protein
VLNRGISQGYCPATSIIERRDISDFAMSLQEEMSLLGMREVFNLKIFIIKALVLPLTAVKKKGYETGEKPRYLCSFAH